jgi:hypothetical protein
MAVLFFLLSFRRQRPDDLTPGATLLSRLAFKAGFQKRRFGGGFLFPLIAHATHHEAKQNARLIRPGILRLEFLQS